MADSAWRATQGTAKLARRSGEAEATLYRVAQGMPTRQGAAVGVEATQDRLWRRGRFTAAAGDSVEGHMADHGSAGDSRCLRQGSSVTSGSIRE